MRAEYKYPVVEFPYKMLTDENCRRTLQDAEFELLDTGKNNCWLAGKGQLLIQHAVLQYAVQETLMLPLNTLCIYAMFLLSPSYVFSLKSTLRWF